MPSIFPLQIRIPLLRGSGTLLIAFVILSLILYHSRIKELEALVASLQKDNKEKDKTISSLQSS